MDRLYEKSGHLPIFCPLLKKFLTTKMGEKKTILAHFRRFLAVFDLFLTKFDGFLGIFKILVKNPFFFSISLKKLKYIICDIIVKK